MNTNYIKSPSESDHWLMKAQFRRDVLRGIRTAIMILVAVALYYKVVNGFFPYQPIV
jgi:hypothetical protein